MAAHTAVSRTPHFRDLDRYFTGPPEELVELYDAALAALEGEQSLAELAAVRVDPDGAEHFKSHWLDEWWPEHQPVEPVLRAGIIEAIRRGRAAQLPLQVLLVEGPPDQFRVAVVEGLNQVTVLVLAPAPRDAAGERDDDGITVIGRDGVEPLAN
jgi:hypothetical protein